MKGKKLSIEQCEKALYRKRVEVDTLKKNVDVSKARGLGNKSWGMIDYLCNHNYFSITGKSEYGRKKI